MSATKLEKLLISEVSGVEDPANEIPGWLVMKSSKFKTGRTIGPDRGWDVGEAEMRVREKTDAQDAPNPAYASCFLWYDGDAPDEDGDGVPDRFGDYKFLVVDTVDDELMIMPQALRAASSRLPGSKIPDSDKEMMGNMLDKLKAKAGIGETAKNFGDTPSSIVARIRAMVFPTGKDDVDMTVDELKATLDERDAALVEKVAEAVAKSVAPAEGASADEGKTDPKTDLKPDDDGDESLTVEDVTKALQDALAPYHEILEKTLDRIEHIETAMGIAARKSLDGQEGATPQTTPTPTVKDAIVSALRSR